MDYRTLHGVERKYEDEDDKCFDAFTCMLVRCPPGKEFMELGIHNMGTLITFNFSWKYPVSWWISNDATGASTIDLPFYPVGPATIKRPTDEKPVLCFPCPTPKRPGAAWKPGVDYDESYLNYSQFPGFVVTPVFKTGTDISVLGDLINNLYQTKLAETQMSTDSKIKNRLPPSLSSSSSDDNLRAQVEELKVFMDNISAKQLDVTKKMLRFEESIGSLNQTDEGLQAAYKSTEILNLRHRQIAERLKHVTQELEELHEAPNEHKMYDTLKSDIESAVAKANINREEINRLKNNLALNFFELRSEIAELKTKVNKK